MFRATKFYRQDAKTSRGIVAEVIKKTLRLCAFAVKKNKLSIPILLTVFLLTANCTQAQESGGAGADNKGGEKTSFKSKRKQRKEDRRLARENRKLKRQEEKAIKEHHKRIQTKDVQKRMKKNRKRDKKQNRKYPT